MCLTDGEETRCHVAFRNFGRLGTSAVFIVLFVRASIFFCTPLALLFSVLDSRSESAEENPQMQTTRLVSTIFRRTFSFRTKVFLNDISSGEDRIPKKELIRAMKIKNPFLSLMDSASSPAGITHLNYLLSRI